MTILQLTVHVGTDMKKNSILARIDKLDPYVKIEIGDQKLQGSVHQNAGGTAYFGETLTTDWDGNSEAKIVVKDDNLLKDVTVGEVVIGAADLKATDLAWVARSHQRRQKDRHSANYNLL